MSEQEKFPGGATGVPEYLVAEIEEAMGVVAGGLGARALEGVPINWYDISPASQAPADTVEDYLRRRTETANFGWFDSRSGTQPGPQSTQQNQ
jgi:hypothetical protein